MSSWNDLLPTELEIGGRMYAIRSDYRDCLEIMRAIADPELSDTDRAAVAITIMYPNAEEIPPEQLQEAVNKAIWFIGCGKPEKNTSSKKPPRLVDWDRDFPLMVAPINKIIGKEVRAVEYMHWWTFMAAWDEIPPDCLWAQVVKIRRKKAAGRPLDKSEMAWYRENKDLIDMPEKYTQEELDFYAQWGGTGGEET